jgi:hypothetical protein
LKEDDDDDDDDDNTKINTPTLNSVYGFDNSKITAGVMLRDNRLCCSM